MGWIQLRVNGTAESAEHIGDLMSAQGALSITFLDSKDTPIFEPLPGETRLWGETDIMGLWQADADVNSILTYLKQHLGEMRYKVEALEDKDWERAWMENFHPMCFGERLWICPSWKPVPDPDAVNVMLDPGLAFGTGTHPTTSLCLQWLDGLDLTGKTIIDFGCGSGILAIAALKLGAARAIGIDIDPQAIEASQANAERNGVAEKLELYLTDDAPDVAGDILVANILAGPLTELAPAIADRTQPGSLLALSGLLNTQTEKVCDAYKPWFTQFDVAEKEEWIRVCAVKND